MYSRCCCGYLLRRAVSRIYGWSCWSRVVIAAARATDARVIHEMSEQQVGSEEEREQRYEAQ